MDSSVLWFSRRPHSLFALFALSLLSFMTLSSRRPAPLHVHHYRRSLRPFVRDVISSGSFSIPPPTISHAVGGLFDPSPTSPLLTSTSSSFSTTSSTTVHTTAIIIITTTTSSIKSSATSPPPTPPTPTTTIPTSSSQVSASVSSSTTTFLIPDVTPSTTFDVGLNHALTSTIVQSTADPSSTGLSSNNTSSATHFWDNKAAVAATFTFISLLGLAFAVIIIVTILRRKKAKRDALIDAEFYQESKSRGSSLAPSFTSSPLDPFKSREIVHVNLPIDYPVSPKPQISLPVIQLTPPSALLPSRYLLPPQLQVPPTTSAAGQHDKSEMRLSTQSAYQPSVDSFYGAYSPA